MAIAPQSFNFSIHNWASAVALSAVMPYLSTKKQVASSTANSLPQKFSHSAAALSLNDMILVMSTP